MQTPILTSIHTAAGARVAGDDVLTYGDVPAEYRAAREGCVLFDATGRGLLAVAGEEAAVFLHRLLANDVRGLQPGSGNRNLLLSPKGKVLYDFDLGIDEERITLSTDPGRTTGLSQALDLYLFAEKVTLEDHTDAHAPLDLCGPNARATVQTVCGALPQDDRSHVTGAFDGAPVRVESLGVAGSPGLRVDAGPERAAALWSALIAAGAQPAGIVVRDILRVEAGAALAGADVDDTVYPQEALLESAFSLDKGCYVGQEVVAKIDTYGGLNKRLIALRVTHDDPVAHGTRLYRDEGGEWRDLGAVTSWAYSFVLDTGLVLAYVKRKHQDEGTTFRLGDGPAEATVVALPVRDDALPVVR
jgi:aminomethyltransferase